jgi:deoxycytidylate deaminase
MPIDDVPSTSHDPELFFAIVSPIGTPSEKFISALNSALVTFGYKPKVIKLSEKLEELARASEFEIPLRHTDRKAALMSFGDDLCLRSDLHSAIAVLGVLDVLKYRKAVHEANGVDEELDTAPVPRTAYILDSLKRPAEVKLLKYIYGDRLIVFGLQSDRDIRRESLVTSLRTYRGANDAELQDEARRLIDRDFQEFSDKSHGQDVLRTFPMADVFVDVDAGIDYQVRKVLKLLFDDPDYEEPTVAEMGMRLAKIAATRSPELGRKVGAVLMRDDGSVAGMGANVHPTRAGSPELDASAINIRDLVLDTLDRLGSDHLNDAALTRLGADRIEFANALIDSNLKDSEIANLTEFMPPVHAEMNALLEAIRNQASVLGTTVYVTAAPCHNCAKHLFGLGLNVQYIEPYPKSRVEDMYGASSAAKIRPFTGIAPGQFDRLFLGVGKRKNRDGLRIVWSDSDRAAAHPKVRPDVEAAISQREAAAVQLLDPGVLIQKSGAESD